MPPIKFYCEHQPTQGLVKATRFTSSGGQELITEIDKLAEYGIVLNLFGSSHTLQVFTDSYTSQDTTFELEFSATVVE